MMFQTKRPYGCINESEIAYLTFVRNNKFALVDKSGNQCIIDYDVFEQLKLKGFTVKEVKPKI